MRQIKTKEDLKTASRKKFYGVGKIISGSVLQPCGFVTATKYKKSYCLMAVDGLTYGNGYIFKGDRLKPFIEQVMASTTDDIINFQVYEFDTYKELFTWLIN